MYVTYIFFSKKYGKIYICHTKNVERRLIEHNSSKNRYTKRYIPWSVIHIEEFNTRSEAMKREKELKSQKGRKFIWNIIRNK